jgi:hypothetical protein
VSTWLRALVRMSLSSEGSAADRPSAAPPPRSRGVEELMRIDVGVHLRTDGHLALLDCYVRTDTVTQRGTEAGAGAVGLVVVGLRLGEGRSRRWTE